MCRIERFECSLDQRLSMENTDASRKIIVLHMLYTKRQKVVKKVCHFDSFVPQCNSTDVILQMFIIIQGQGVSYMSFAQAKGEIN